MSEKGYGIDRDERWIEENRAAILRLKEAFRNSKAPGERISEIEKELGIYEKTFGALVEKDG